MANYVQGSYKTAEEANAAVDSLIAEGYDSSDITLVSNGDADGALSTHVHNKIYSEDHSEDESLFDKIKDKFTGDSNHTSNSTTKNEDIVLDHYTDEINNGRIVILLDEKPDVDRSVDHDNYPTADPSANSVADPMSTNPEVAVGSINQPAIDPAFDSMDQTNTEPVDPAANKETKEDNDINTEGKLTTEDEKNDGFNPRP